MELGGLKIRLTGDASQLNATLTQTQQKVTKFGDILKSNAGKLAGLFGVAGVGFAAGDMLKKGIENAMAWEKAQKKLYFATNQNAAATERFVKTAEQLHKTTIFEKDDIVAAQAFAQSLGRTEEQTNKMITTAMGMSRVLGVDMQDSMMKLSGSMEGMLRGLGRYDSRLKDLTPEQLRAGKAIDLLGEKFNKFATTGTTSISGRILMWKKQFNEALEAVGNFILGIKEIDTATRMENERIQVNNLTMALTEANVPADERNRLYDELLKLAPEVLNGIDKEKIAYDQLRKNLEDYNIQAINRIIIARKQTEIDKQQEKAASLKEKVLNRENEIRTKMNLEITQDEKSKIEIFKKYGNELKKISLDQTKTLYEKALAMEELSQTMMGKATYYGLGDLAILLKGEQNAFESSNFTIEKLANDRKKLMKEFGITDTKTTPTITPTITPLTEPPKKKTKDEIFEEDFRRNEEMVAKIWELLDNAEKQKEELLKKESEAEENANDITLRESERLAASMESVEKASTDKAIEEEKRKLEERKRLQDEYFGYVAQGTGSLFEYINAMQTMQKNDELAMAGKNQKKIDAINRQYAERAQRTAIAQAIINGALGVTKIWSVEGVVPWVAAVQSALVLAEVGAQVATIRSQRFAAGGLLYGPTMAMAGEYPGAASNPEVIAPLDKLKSLIGEGSGNVVFTIKGDDLKGVLDRNTTRQALIR